MSSWSTKLSVVQVVWCSVCRSFMRQYSTSTHGRTHCLYYIKAGNLVGTALRLILLRNIQGYNKIILNHIHSMMRYTYNIVKTSDVLCINIGAGAGAAEFR